jgi:hypothetical protein
MMAEDRQRQQQQQDLANGETAAKAAKAQADGQAALITANALKQKTDQEGFVAGHEIMAKKQEEKKLKLVGGK